MECRLPSHCLAECCSILTEMSSDPIGQSSAPQIYGWATTLQTKRSQVEHVGTS